MRLTRHGEGIGEEITRVGDEEDEAALNLSVSSCASSSVTCRTAGTKCEPPNSLCLSMREHESPKMTPRAMEMKKVRRKMPTPWKNERT